MTTFRSEDCSVDIPAAISGYVGGEPVAAGPDAAQLTIFNPSTEEPVTRLHECDPDIVGRAVAAARQAFEEGPWRGMAVRDRQRVLRRAAAVVVEERQDLAIRESVCVGLPVAHLAGRQIPRAAENFALFADFIGVMAGETFEQQTGFLTTVTREPAGVAALLAPWNAPLALGSMQIASCIAFGNTCVIKPSEHAPLSTLRLVELLEQAGLPPGVVNVVNGRGEATGAALANHSGVDRIAFTGRADTARNIMRAAGANLTPVHFQLGGNGANLVFDDAELDRAIDGSLINAFSNGGQLCVAGSRILVQRGVADEFIGRFAERAARLRLGDPLDPRTEVGPLAFSAQRDRVLDYLDLARREGAEILAGGGRAPGFERGYYVEPTVALITDSRWRVCREEVFGPFATIQVFDDADEAIALANDSDYGLVAYAWTSSVALTARLQREIRAGTLWINTPLARDLRAPFGGFRRSGIGRDGPRQCAEFFTEEKATVIPRERIDIQRLGED